MICRVKYLSIIGASAAGSSPPGRSGSRRRRCSKYGKFDIARTSCSTRPGCSSSRPRLACCAPSSCPSRRQVTRTCPSTNPDSTPLRIEELLLPLKESSAWWEVGLRSWFKGIRAELQGQPLFWELRRKLNHATPFAWECDRVLRYLHWIWCSCKLCLPQHTCREGGCSLREEFAIGLDGREEPLECWLTPTAQWEKEQLRWFLPLYDVFLPWVRQALLFRTYRSRVERYTQFCLSPVDLICF